MSACGVITPIRVGAQSSGCQVAISALLETAEILLKRSPSREGANSIPALRRTLLAVAGAHENGAWVATYR